MTKSTVKKSDRPTAPGTAATPALVAFHALPGPKGKQPVLTPIGFATEHPDGEGFNLHLHLIPTGLGGRIVLRKPKSKAEANANALAQKKH